MNDYIPKYLKQRAQWVNWAYKTRENGKQSKIPYMPNGTPAKTTDPLSLSTYEAVQNTTGFNGIGFVLREGDNLTGIDLDHCIQDGKIEAWALAVLALFNNTYIEYSPSKQGLHIWVFGKPTRCGKGTTEKRIEIYDYTSPRYLTVTGQAYNQDITNIAHLQPQLDQLHKQYFKQADDKTPAFTPTDCARLPDILTLTKNDIKFNALYKGDFTGYPSQSEADYALCLKLAFYTQNNAQEIDRLFRSSGLYREKWDKKNGALTYGQKTIQNVLAKSSNTIQHKPNNTGDFVQPVQTEQTSKPTKTHESLPAQSQLGEYLADKLKNLAFDDVREDWVIYKDNHWQTITNREALRYINTHIKREVGELGYSSAFLNSVTSFIQILSSHSDWNTIKEAIPFKNGILRLTDRKLIAHSPQHRNTWIIPYDYNPLATCEPITQWLNECVNNKPDQVQLLRAYMNAILTGRVDLQRYLELIGSGGTGKGTFIRLCEMMMGADNCHSTELKHLENNRFETANLYGKRLITVTDSQGYAGDVSVFKACTGGDSVRYEEKNKQGGRGFKLEALFILAANEPIASKDYTSGISRRRITVTFNNQVASTKRRDLTTEFSPHIGGLINWLLDMPTEHVTALVRDTSQTVPSLAITEYENLLAVNPLAQWLDENIVYIPDTQTFIGNCEREDGKIINMETKLYPNYVHYSESSGNRPLSLVRFVSLLLELCRSQLGLSDIERIVTREGRVITNLAVKCGTNDAHESPLSAKFKTSKNPKNPSLLSTMRVSTLNQPFTTLNIKHGAGFQEHKHPVLLNPDKDSKEMVKGYEGVALSEIRTVLNGEGFEGFSKNSTYIAKLLQDLWYSCNSENSINLLDEARLPEAFYKQFTQVLSTHKNLTAVHIASIVQRMLTI
ncbi:phage/plasmid primase, P4 family [Beggiatoa leptomitoformis]|nr:phage/plasmid primase, P4 family [Beggiatoa leptomitoformis]